MKDLNKPPYTKMKISDLQTPKPGRLVYGPSWWIVTDDDCVLFFRKHSPQCNSNKLVSEHLRDKLYPGLEVRFIEHAFLPHSCSDYCG